MEYFGRYLIRKRLKGIGKSMKWLREELKSRGYDVAYNHLGEYITADPKRQRPGPKGDRLCAVASAIISEYEKGE